MRNKKGADKIISVYWFVILFLVAGAIVYMVYSFYGKPLDVREIEANILINQVADCISKNGKITNQLNDEFKDNFMEICNLNFETEFKEDGEYYIGAVFYDINDNPLNFEIAGGNINLRNTYLDTPKSNSIAYLSRSLYVLNENEEENIVKILSVVRKTEKNVR
ncbi:hypothetical protein HYT24_01725 [Candidatus Pacearchaeota archaeon]|nr:hypothetical protein [Candidatus Pacearchaeota archaeon]